MKGLQELVQNQQKALETSINNLESTMKAASGSESTPSDKIPALDAEIKNLNTVISDMAKSAEKLTEATNKSYTTLTASTNDSLTQMRRLRKNSVAEDRKLGIVTSDCIDLMRVTLWQKKQR